MAVFSLITARCESHASDAGLDLVRRIAHALGQGGHILRNAALTSADQAAVVTALDAGGRVELWLPTGVETPDWLLPLGKRHPRRLRAVTLDAQRNSMLVAAAGCGFGRGRSLSSTAARELACIVGLLAQSDLALFYSGGASPRGRDERGDLEPALAYAESLGLPILDLGTTSTPDLSEVLCRYRLTLPPEGTLRPLPAAPQKRESRPNASSWMLRLKKVLTGTTD